MQTRKEDVDLKIREAAIGVFTVKGFKGATMARIAKEAGIAVGNIYHYYSSKEDLFHALLEPAFNQIMGLPERIIRDTFDISSHQFDFDRLENYLYTLVLEIFTSFRREILIFMEGSEGTPYSSFPQRVMGVLETQLFSLFHGKSENPERDLERFQVMMNVIIENLIQGLTNVMRLSHTKEDIDILLKAYLRFFFAGLKGLTAEPVLERSLAGQELDN